MAHFPISAHDYISKRIPELTYGQSKIISSIDSCNYVFIAAAPRAAGRTTILTEYITWEFTWSRTPISFTYGSLGDKNYSFRHLDGYRYGSNGYNNYKNRNNGCVLEIGSISKILDLSRHRGLVPSDVLVLDGLLDNNDLDALYRYIDNAKNYIGREITNFTYSHPNDRYTYKVYNSSRYVIVCHDPEYEANMLLKWGVDSDEIAIIESKDLKNFYNTKYDYFTSPQQFNSLYLTNPLP